MCIQHLHSIVCNNFLECVFIRSSFKIQHSILLYGFTSSDGITSLKWVARISLIDSLQVFQYCLDTTVSETGYWFSFNGVEMENTLDLAYICNSVEEWSHLVFGVYFIFNKGNIQMFCLHSNAVSSHIKTTISKPTVFTQKCFYCIVAN